MGICIEIQKNDDGTYQVSECEPKEETAEMELGQTVRSLDEAIGVLTDLLSGDTGEQAEEAMASMQKGYGAMPVKQTPQAVFGEE